MTRQEVLQKMVHEVISRGIVSNQKELASLIHGSDATISAALAGNKDKLSAKLLRRINYATGRIFNPDWVATGEGPIYSPIKPVPDTSIDIDMSQTASGHGTNISGNDTAALIKLQLENDYLRKQNEDLQQQVTELKAERDKANQRADDLYLQILKAK